MEGESNAMLETGFPVGNIASVERSSGMRQFYCLSFMHLVPETLMLTKLINISAFSAAKRPFNEALQQFYSKKS